ncbi:MAG: PHP domain-containing protein [Myxococcales bacterium]|nr:PHP domain-containing protein [Myxococcales bacterium]
MRVAVLCLTIFVAMACGDNDPDALALYYPGLPDPTGEPQGASAGPVTSTEQLLTGPAASGMVGDFFLANDRVKVIVSAPTRVIGVIPQGGNIVDAALLQASGTGVVQATPDHFGELAMIYALGRTCDHETLEVVRDGKGGGVAALRAVGRSANDDFLNLRGAGLPVDSAVDPEFEDSVTCATTYVLAPGATSVEVYHSLYNPTESLVVGPLGTIADTGGDTEAWTTQRGFVRAGIEALTSRDTAPTDYVVYQSPGVAYGVIPRHNQPTINTSILIAGVSIFLLGVDQLSDVLDRSQDFMRLTPRTGRLQAYDLVIGADAASTGEKFRATTRQAQRQVAGRVQWSRGGAARGARVGVFLDGNGDGQLDNNPGGALDAVVAYFDVAADGTFAGQVADVGNLLVRADVKDVGRSAVTQASAQLMLTIPSPIRVDYQILDEANAPIPGRLLVVGRHPASPDARLFETFDRMAGIVRSLHTVGDLSDPDLELPAGGSYRIFASRGTEWSVADARVTEQPTVPVLFRLQHVAPAVGYYGTEWHVHQVGSPDSPVLSDERVRSAASAGVEMFAVTDHDYVADLQPLVRQMGLERVVRVMPGIEVTPFAYGHFNAWPIAPQADSPNGGAVDWARGATLGLAMTPGQIYGEMRARGATMVQVNHPRSSGFGQFQAFFDRANLVYDYTRRTIFGDFAKARVPNEILRLPEESLWSDAFNALEVWNGFSTADTDGDGILELTSADRVLRDWFNMLSLGLFVTPLGNSDSHTSVSDPLGMPRTYVRVSNDSAAMLDTTAAMDEVLATLSGKTASGAAVPRDVVITDGPMLDVRVAGNPAIGRVHSATGSITLAVAVTSPQWADFDTIEVFANQTPTSPTDASALVPLQCWTTRANLAVTDPCMRATLPPANLTVQVRADPPGPRLEASRNLVVNLADIPRRAGATGNDAWLVVRVRGDRGIFPLMSSSLLSDQALLDTALGGSAAELRAALAHKGAPAQALTAPIFVDFDGSGYRAPFAP